MRTRRGRIAPSLFPLDAVWDVAFDPAHTYAPSQTEQCHPPHSCSCCGGTAAARAPTMAVKPHGLRGFAPPQRWIGMHNNLERRVTIRPEPRRPECRDMHMAYIEREGFAYGALSPGPSCGTTTRVERRDRSFLYCILYTELLYISLSPFRGYSYSLL